MLYNIKYVMLYNICHDMLYNICQVIEHITYVMLCYVV